MKPLVLCLGNELLADDAAGIIAAAKLKADIGDQADIVDTSLSGMALLEYFIGYEQAIIVDAIHTGKHEPGSVIEIDQSELKAVIAPSPHYAGLPEMLEIAKLLGVDFPKDIKIFAIEAADPYTIGGEIDDRVRDGIDRAVERVKAELERMNSASVENIA